LFIADAPLPVGGMQLKAMSIDEDACWIVGGLLVHGHGQAAWLFSKSVCSFVHEAALPSFTSVGRKCKRLGLPVCPSVE